MGVNEKLDIGGFACICCGKPAAGIVVCPYCKKTDHVLGWTKCAEMKPDGEPELVRFGDHMIAARLMVPSKYEPMGPVVSPIKCGNCGNPCGYIVCCAYCQHGWMNNWDVSELHDEPIMKIGQFDIVHGKFAPLMALM